MSMKQVTKIRLNATSHSVRAAQAVLQYGVGAMVDFPSQTLMTAAPEYWQDQVVHIHDERLEKSLGVRYFGMPKGGKNGDGIAYTRFPEWYFCPKCRKFQPLSRWIAEFNSKAKDNEKVNNQNMSRVLRCPTDRVELVVARIVTVCQYGHINDFPWVKWTHAKSFGGAREVCGNPPLTYFMGYGLLHNSNKVVHQYEVAEASSHNKYMKDFMCSEIRMICIKCRHLNCIYYAANSVEDSAGEKPEESGSGKC